MEMNIAERKYRAEQYFKNLSASNYEDIIRLSTIYLMVELFLYYQKEKEWEYRCNDAFEEMVEYHQLLKDIVYRKRGIGYIFSSFRSDNDISDDEADELYRIMSKRVSFTLYPYAKHLSLEYVLPEEDRESDHVTHTCSQISELFREKLSIYFRFEPHLNPDFDIVQLLEDHVGKINSHMILLIRENIKKL
jgi:hypothetical protein